MKRIGIITWHYYPNYGSRLQAYALFRYLEICGYNVFFINYRNTKFENSSFIRKLLVSCIIHIPEVICRCISKRLTMASQRFDMNYLPQTKKAHSEKELSELVGGFFSIICGSDQIWAPNVFNPVYMLNFVPDGINKIAYAASIGLESIPTELVDDYKKHIGRINHVSVREEKGKEILKVQCGIDSTVVLDPTLLLPKTEWDRIKKRSTIKEKYIFCYFLNKDHNYKELVIDYADRNNCTIYGVSDKVEDSAWMQTFDYRTVGPLEFIGLIEGAQSVFTDSYHGTIFSLIYHKSFILFERFNINDRICQNSRIEQLNNYFDIDDNIVKADSISSIEVPSIDYGCFENTLANLREKSKSFLDKSLQ